MTHEFCIKCGAKNSFEVSKPNFCAGCGEPFNRAGASVSRAKEEEEEEHNIFDTSSIENGFYIETPHQGNRLTFGDVIKNPQPRQPKTARPDKDRGLQGQDLVKKSIQECSRATSKTFGEKNRRD